MTIFVLTAVFDIWVYLNTRNFDFMLSAWMNRHKTIDAQLLPKQAALLKAICLVERGLKYFFYFVLLPVMALSVYFVINNAK